MSHSQRRILALCEGRFSPLKSKTANAALLYFPEQIIAIVDSTQSGRTAQDVLGYGGGVPVVASVDDGLSFDPTHLLIGIAPPGGLLPDSWRNAIRIALQNRLHVLSGLHTLLAEDPEFQAYAEVYGVTITDYRRIPPEAEVIPKGSWRTRTANVILTVGTDSNIGKMTVSIELEKEFARRGLRSDFVATGQTGILVRGRGIAVDSIISDYASGCIEREVDRSVNEGNKFIFVEGQGALTQLAYSAVTLGLMHGSMPNAMIMCHQPTRKADNFGLPLISLPDAIRLHTEVFRHFRPVPILGIGINGIGLRREELDRACSEIERETGLPTVDVLRHGAGRLVDNLLKHLTAS